MSIDAGGVRFPVMTWPKIAALCGSVVGSVLVAAAGAVWAIGSLWLGSMDQRLGSMDESIKQLHDEFAQVAKDSGDLKGLLGGQRADLTKEISETHDIVVQLGGKLDTVVAQLGGKLDTVNYRLGDLAENMKELRGDVSVILPKKQ